MCACIRHFYYGFSEGYMIGEICRDCPVQSVCPPGEACAAAGELRRIWEEQDIRDKAAIVRGLARKLGIQNTERSPELRRMAERIIRRIPQLAHIGGVKVGYVMSCEPTHGEKIKFADCRKVPEVYRAWLPYDFIITFYACNTGALDENQRKIVMLHELMHIGMGPRGYRIVPHDVEDFKAILGRFGLKWSALDNRGAPDILLAGLDGDSNEGEEA